MSKSFFDVAHAHSKAINKNSAMAVSGGLSYSPSLNGDDAFDLPPAYWLLRDLPTRFKNDPKSLMSCAAIYGRRSFRLTVLGLSKDLEKSTSTPCYVCKCSCGMYCLRQARNLKRNPYASCGVCKKNHKRINSEHHAKTGVYLDDAVIWQRMGGA